VKPSAMREIMVDVPNVKFTDIGGQDDIKQKLIEVIELPLQQPEVFRMMNIAPPKGILLYGAPGNSKTMMARALATESRRNFIAVKSSELFSKYVGESEKAVKALFHKARAASPCIVFFDELDALAASRGDAHSHATNGAAGGHRVGDRVLSQLLIELDGVEALHQVTVLAATNRPDMIDKALLRPGRFDRMLYVSPPNESSRAAILALHLSKVSHNDDVDIQCIARMTDGYSGAEMIGLCKAAALAAMDEDVNAAELCMRHFHSAIQNYTSRTSPESIEWYENYGRNMSVKT
jgi:AAA family ATPase